jgi:hypothetical protein
MSDAPSPSPRPLKPDVIRCLCFAACWLVALAVALARRGDSAIVLKVSLFVPAALLAALLVPLLLRKTWLRGYWLLEVIAIPFCSMALTLAGALLYRLIRTHLL